jgi:chemotaxis protein methyltransferase CheR
MQNISSLEFERLSSLLHEHSGVYLQPNQAYLIETRLSQLTRNLGLKTVTQLLARLQQEPENLLQCFISLMTTHETLWFRDHSCWNALEKMIFPALFKQIALHHQPIKIWCAGCSTGQEAYSLAILIDELCHRQQRTDWIDYFSIRAMDICETVLKTARQAEYTAFEIGRGLSLTRRLHYFDEDQRHYWQLKPELRSRVQFEPINLIHDFSHLGKFDLILCRNVTIYFKPQVRQQILAKMVAMLKPAGALLIGATESLGQQTENFSLAEFENCVYVNAAKKSNKP